MFIKINNLKMYYVVKGQGPAIILIHGNGESHNIFDVLIEELAMNFKVYAIDSRNHGQSSMNLEINYDLMCEDVVNFIQQLHINKPIIYGFSDGGIIALKIAIKYPNLLTKIIISGANLNPSGLKLRTRIGMYIIYLLKRDPLYRMMLNEPNINPLSLQQINIPVVVTVGQYDVIKLQHTKQIIENLKNVKFEIIPNANHDSYIIHSEKIFRIINKYL